MKVAVRTSLLAAWVATAALLLALAGSVAVVPAFAAQESESLVAGGAVVSTTAKPTIYTQTLWVGSKVSENLQVFDWPSNATLTKVKSSNTKVLKVAKQAYTDGTEYWHWMYKPLKAGTSTITVTYKQAGATKTIKAKIKVKKYPTVFKSITLDGKKLALPTKSSTSNDINIFGYTKTKPNIKVVPAKGWKINYIGASTAKTGSYNFSDIKVANGKAFSLPKGKWCTYHISMENSAGDFFYCNVVILRTDPITLTDSVVYVGEAAGLPIEYATINNDWQAKLVSITSSNKKALTVSKSKGSTSVSDPWYDALKTGTSKLTMKYKFEGKTYTTSALYTVKAYPNAIKSLKVNGSAVNLKNNAFIIYYDSYKKASAKVNLTPAAGWKIVSIENVSSKNNYIAKKAKNNTKIAIEAGGWLDLTYKLKSTKTGDIFEYSVHFQR